MKKPLIFCFILIVFLILLCVFESNLFAQESQSQQNGQENAIKIYIDGYWELDYIRQELKFANYVRDPKLADVYILVSTQSTVGC